VLVTELLGANLFETLSANQFIGLHFETVRDIAEQLFGALGYLHDVAGLYHADVKPENILLSGPEQIRLADFGTASVKGHQLHGPYIQSRFYRAPEVLLGCAYDKEIDLWSAGCVVAECFLGLPLFPGADEWAVAYRQVEMRGYSPAKLLAEGQATARFFRRCGVGEKGPPLANPGALQGRIPDLDPSEGWVVLGEQEYYSRQAEEGDGAGGETGNKQGGEGMPVFKRYFRYSSLEDVVRHYPYLERPGGGAEKNQTERQANLEWERSRGRPLLTDFLDRLLCMAPSARMEAADALQHPFLAGDPWPSEADAPAAPLPPAPEGGLIESP